MTDCFLVVITSLTISLLLYSFIYIHPFIHSFIHSCFSKRMLRLRLRDEEQFLTLRRTNDFASLKLRTPVELLLQICDQYWEEAMKNKNNSLLA